MKTLRKILFITVAAMFLATQAKAVLYWGRPYDPNLQRWIQRDPIAERGGINLYDYVGNNPVSEIDPIGLEQSFGNPVYGPNGTPVGPSTPYAPGIDYPNGFLYTAEPYPSITFPINGAFLIGGWQSPKTVPIPGVPNLGSAKPEVAFFGGYDTKHQINGGCIVGLGAPIGSSDFTLAGEGTYSQNGGFNYTGINIFDVHSPLPRYPIGGGVFVNDEGDLGIYFYGFNQSGAFFGFGFDLDPGKL
jgi:hypothetical protein